MVAGIYFPDGIDTVSYTHLDVYKRQLLDGKDAETSRVFQLAPKVLQKILEHAGISVNFQERVPV